MFQQYRSNEIFEMELTVDGGAVIRNPKNHGDTRRVSKDDFKEHYVLIENPAVVPTDKEAEEIAAAQRAQKQPSTVAEPDAPKRKVIPETQMPLKKPIQR